MRYYFLALCLIVGSAHAQTSTPENVTAVKTANGVEVRSASSAMPFVVEIQGKTIKPLAPNRLLWQVDSKQVEILTAAVSWELPAAADAARKLTVFGQDEIERVRKEGWHPSTPIAAFKDAAGMDAVIWSLNDAKGRVRWQIATLAGGRILTLVCIGAVADGRDLSEWLRSTISTVKRGPVPPSRAEIPDPQQRGMALGGMLRLREALSGKPALALVNEKLITGTDAKIPGVVRVSPEALLATVTWIVETGTNMLQTSVFDGHSSHAINLTGSVYPDRSITYWDPWGQGSFLQKANNRAGVEATPHPSEARIWVVKAPELMRVLYSGIVDVESLMATVSLFTWLSRRDIEALDEIVTRHKEDPKLPELSFEYLGKARRYLALRSRPEEALFIEQVRTVLYPKEASAQAKIAEADLEAAGLADPGARLALRFTLPPPGGTARITTLADAQRTDFFKFFRLRRVDGDGAAETVRFRPTGEKFREWTELTATTDSEGAVRVWTLWLARDFLSAQMDSIFAGDFAKSFLMFLFPDPIHRAHRLATEIWGRHGRKDVPVPGANPPASIMPMPTLGMGAYLGTRVSYEMGLHNGTLKLANSDVGTSQLNKNGGLTITVEIVPTK